MVRVALDSFGVSILWQGGVDREEAERLPEYLRTHLDGFKGPFGAMAELTEADVPDSPNPWLMDAIRGIEMVLIEAGMTRSVIVLNDYVFCARLQLIAHELGRLDLERYVAPHSNPEWRLDAARWLTDEVEPSGQWEVNLERARSIVEELDRANAASVEELLVLAEQRGMIRSGRRHGEHVIVVHEGEQWMLPSDEAERQLRRGIRARAMALGSH